MPPNPPRNTKETNPFQGISISPIDQYGLGDVVKKLRSTPDVKMDAIVAELNDKYLVGDMPKTSISALYRWCAKNGVNDIDGRFREDFAVNVYQQNKEMLEDVNDQLNTLKAYLETINSKIKNREDITNSAKEMKDMLLISEKLMARKQSLLNSIAVMQEKVYSYNSMTEILGIITDMVRERDLTLYADIQEEFRKNPILLEAYKKIQPESKKKQ